MNDSTDDLIGDGAADPGEALKRTPAHPDALIADSERDSRTPRPVDLAAISAAGGRGRPKRYTWADRMKHGEAIWLPGEKPSGTVASSIRSRFNKPGQGRRFAFRSSVDERGREGCWCICVDVREDPDQTRGIFGNT